MRTHSRPSRSGFTLLELLAAVLLMSIISVTLMPVIAGASDSYTVARDARSATERAAFALDRVTRVVREAPIGPSDTGVGVTSASTTAIAFTDNTGFQLIGTTLEMLVPGESPVPLCFDVDSFTIVYLADDGVTTTLSTPALTHRFVFTIETQGIEMAALVHPRVWIGQSP